MSATTHISEQGFTAVPRETTTFIEQYKTKSAPSQSLPNSLADIPLPDSYNARAVDVYAKTQLPPETYFHSLRVFYYGECLRALFPSVLATLSRETHYMTCLLHDIGTSPINLTLDKTHMSFEFAGGMLAHSLLIGQLRCSSPQADAVAEAIFRHQDLGEKGTITALGQLIQIATVADNMTPQHLKDLLTESMGPDMLREIHEKFPRSGWAGCFAATIRKEVELKPWCHTTKIGGSDGEEFAGPVEKNEGLKEFEEVGKERLQGLVDSHE